MFSFELLAREGDARAGKLLTPHGIIETPSFVAVGTQATVGALFPKRQAVLGIVQGGGKYSVDPYMDWRF